MRSWLCLMVCAITLLCTTDALHKETYPSPYEAPEKCWGHDSKHPANLKICDPDGIVSDEQARALQSTLTNLYRTSTCPCKSDICHIRRLAGDNGGYNIVVALVRNMTVSDSNKLEAARIYANYLRKVGGYYNRRWSKCEEDITIFLSFNDRVVYIVTGSTARQALPDNDLETIIVDSRSPFKNSVYDGIEFILSKIGEKLKMK